MTHSMSIFCVIRSATALSIIAAVNIRLDTRTTKRLGQESSRPSLKPIPLCNMNRRTFAFGENAGDTVPSHPSLQQPLSSYFFPVGTHHDDSDRERHPSLVVRQVSGRRLHASRSVEKMHRQFLRADSTPLPSSGRAGLRQGIGQ